MALTRPRYSQIYDTDYKQSVRVATTADVGNLLATGNMTNTVDGVTLNLLDRILVKDQSDAKQNGIYRVLTVGSGSDGTWGRALDADANDKVTSGLTTTVAEGDTNSYKTFRLATSDPITLGVTELVFVNPFSAGASSVAGATGQIQFNNLGLFSASPNLTFNTTGNILSVGGNISSGGFFIGNGSQLTGLPENYSNSSVAAYLPTHTGNVSANYFIGNIITSGATVDGAIFTENQILNIEAGTSNIQIYSSDNVAISTSSIANVVVVNSVSTTISGNLLPAANVTYDLGSPTQRWRTGYFAANTLDLGGATISIDPTNGFTFAAPGFTAVSLSGNASLSADIITANTQMKGYVDATITANISALINGSPETLNTLNEIAAALGNDANLSVTLTNQIAGIQGNVTAANAAIVTANTAMKGYVDSALAGISSNSISTANTSVTTSSDFVNVRVANSNVATFQSNKTTIHTDTVVGNASVGVTHTLTLDNPNAFSTQVSDNFGWPVYASENYILVPNQGEDDASGNSSGKAYVFNTLGTLLYTLDNPNPVGTSTGDFFGSAGAIDDRYIVVSAIGEENIAGNVQNVGRVYVYDTTTGSLLYTLNNPTQTVTFDSLGYAVALSGNYIVASAPFGTVGNVHIYNSNTGTFLYSIANPNPYGTSDDDYFGWYISASGDNLIVGAPQESEAAGAESGKAYIFDLTTGQLIHTLNNPNAFRTVEYDNFGYSVGISGNYAIVGAVYEDDDPSTDDDSGAAYIFDVTTGQLLHTLSNPNTGLYEQFGEWVSISGDYAVVGARTTDDSGNNSGKAYLYDVPTGELIHTFDNPNVFGTSDNDNFGYSVAIAGKNIVIGTPLEDKAGITNTGRVYVYAIEESVQGNLTTGSLTVNNIQTVSDTLNIATEQINVGERSITSTLVSTITSPTGGGFWVDVSGDRAVASFPSGGNVRVYDPNTGTILYTVSNFNANTLNTNDTFGAGLAINEKYLVIGATFEDDAGGQDSGKVYLCNAINGTLIRTFDNPNAFGTSADDYFGGDIAISGEYIIAGASFEGNTGTADSGVVYVFNAGDGSLLHTIVNPDASSAHNYFGRSSGGGTEGISAYGKYLVIGAEEYDSTASNNRGRAYVYDLGSGALIHTLAPDASGLQDGSRFGRSVSISGNYIVVGHHRFNSMGNTDAGGNSGRAYIFDAVTGSIIRIIENPNPYGTGTFDYFGYSVDADVETDLLAISSNAEWHNDNLISDNEGSGKVYIYRLSTGELLQTISNPNVIGTPEWDQFGDYIALSGYNLIVGATGENTYSGAVYLFKLTESYSGNVSAGAVTVSGRQVLTAVEAPYVGLNSIIRTNSTTITANTTIPTGTNGMSAGPITIAEGVTVTIATGGEWSIV